MRAWLAAGSSGNASTAERPTPNRHFVEVGFYSLCLGPLWPPPPPPPAVDPAGGVVDAGGAAGGVVNAAGAVGVVDASAAAFLLFLIFFL